jgi:uncharacterized protein
MRKIPLKCFCLLLSFAAGYAVQNAPAPADLLKQAQSGDANAQLELGRAYEDGKGVPQDDGLAVEWFRKAAEQGSASAQNSLGVMYSVGRGVAQNKEEAFRWYKKAAKQGLHESLFNVAISYFNGEGVPSDLNLAYAWMKAAKDSGDAQAVDALKRITDEIHGRIDFGELRLAEMYEKGEDIPKNLSSAANIYLATAKNDKDGMNVTHAQFKVCTMYAAGTGLPLDLTQAKVWCQKVGKPPYGPGEREVRDALMLLGRIAEHDKKSGEAASWYAKAILAGDGRGFLPLAKLKMQNGPKGEREAYFWLYLSKQFDPASTQVEFQQLSARLEPGDIAKENKRAYQWLEKHAPEKAKSMKQQ